MNELLMEKIALLPEEIKNLLKVVVSDEHFVTLVGGAVRDILLGRGIPSNLDFEMRLRTKGADPKAAIERFRQKLIDSGHHVEDCPFGIIRVHVGQFELEFAPPRTETFSLEKGHKNFTVEFCFDAPYEISWKRRDFTINAMGIEIHDIETLKGPRFIDPFSGAKHLQKKELHLCGEDFFRDPVRFCRAIRFRLSSGFSWGGDLQESLKKFDLSELSTHYFFSEAARLNFNPSYFDLFFETVTEKKIPLKDTIADFKLLRKVGEFGVKVDDVSSLLAALAQIKGSTEELLNRLGAALDMKKAESSAVYSLYQSLVAFPQGFEKRFRNHLHLNGPEIAISDEALFDKVLEIVVLLKKRVCPKESAFAKKLSLRLHFLKTLAPEGDVFKGHEELETFLREKKIADPRIAQRLKWFFHFKNVLGT